MATGGRRGRFRTRRDALSGPEHPENNLDTFNFRTKESGSEAGAGIVLKIKKKRVTFDLPALLGN